MRIGLYGSMANNMYCLAKVMRKQGYDACYVDNALESYPLCQPVWEDVELTIEHRELPRYVADPQAWGKVVAQQKWRRPEWVVDPGPSKVSVKTKVAMAYRTATLPIKASRSYYRMTLDYLRDDRRLIQHLAGYDWLIVCGLGVVPVYFSGTPYLFWPHGGDINASPYVSETAYQRWYAIMLRRAITGATVKGTHDPNAVDSLRRLGVRGPVPYLPFIVDTDRYAPSPESGRGLLPEEALARAQGKRIVLLSSRQDFYWKGTDQFIRAFIRSVREGADLFLVISRWGADVSKTEAMIAEAGVEASVHYLDYVMSKPLLIRFYNLADVVVDQFVFRAFGTTMLEAMACAKPVMINLDINKFKSQWPSYEAPPVINPQDEEGIYQALRQIDEGKLDLKGMGNDARRWIQNYHSFTQLNRYLPSGMKISDKTARALRT